MKYLKFLFYYLKSKNVETNPSVDVLLQIIKELDNKSDKQNIKKFDSHPIAKKLYEEKQHLLDYINTHEFDKNTFGYDLKEFWSAQSVDLLKEGMYAPSKFSFIASLILFAKKNLIFLFLQYFFIFIISSSLIRSEL